MQDACQILPNLRVKVKLLCYLPSNTLVLLRFKVDELVTLCPDANEALDTLTNNLGLHTILFANYSEDRWKKIES